MEHSEKDEVQYPWKDGVSAAF